jgi:hypothetical protein
MAPCTVQTASQLAKLVGISHQRSGGRACASNCTESISSNGKITMNDKFGERGKKVAVAYFKIVTNT